MSETVTASPGTQPDLAKKRYSTPFSSIPQGKDVTATGDLSQEPIQGPLTKEQQAELDALKHERQKAEIDAIGEALLKKHTGEVTRLLEDKKTTPEQKAALESAQSTKAFQLINWARKTQAVQDGGVSLQGDAPILYIGGKEYRPKSLVKLEGDKFTCIDHNGQPIPPIHRNQLIQALLASERTAIVQAMPEDQQAAMNAYIDMQIANAKGEEYIVSDTAGDDIESAAISAGFISGSTAREFVQNSIADEAKRKEVMDYLEDKSFLMPDELGTVIGYSIDQDSVRTREAHHNQEIAKFELAIGKTQQKLEALKQNHNADPKHIQQLQHELAQLQYQKQDAELDKQLEMEQLEQIGQADVMFEKYYDMVLNGDISVEAAQQFEESMRTGKFDQLLKTMEEQFKDNPQALTKLQQIAKHINMKNGLTLGGTILALVTLMMLQSAKQ